MRLQPKPQLRKKEIVKIVGSYLQQIDACKISKNPDDRTMEKLEELALDIIDVLENAQADWISDIIIDFTITHFGKYFSKPFTDRELRASLTEKAGKAAKLIVGICNERRNETYNTSSLNG